jgi:hypothetical protein
MKFSFKIQREAFNARRLCHIALISDHFITMGRRVTTASDRK